jgi:hypothetical protein
MTGKSELQNVEEIRKKNSKRCNNISEFYYSSTVCAWKRKRPPTTRLTAFHVCKTRGCQCSFRLLMMGGVSPETCWASYKHGIIKFWYIVECCLIFLYELYYDARIHEHQITWKEVVAVYIKTPSMQCLRGPSKIMKISEQPISEPRFESGTH